MTPAIASSDDVLDTRQYRTDVRCAVTPQRWTADYRVLPFVRRPDAPVSTRASFTIEAGRPGAHPA